MESSRHIKVGGYMNDKTIVVNIYKESYDIYIGRGRGSMWGNPYNIGEYGAREEVIELYKMHLWKQIKQGKITREDLLALDGKRLGCFCKPQACHGDVIVKAVEWVKGQKQS
jgi:hypothetical protein